MISPALIWLVVLGVRPACSQAAPASGLYQIVSGRYFECCGIGGAFVHLLPDNIQAFIELTIGPENNGARMRILGSDMQTVFTIPPSASRPGLTFDLSNGAVYPDRIEFGIPLPNQLFYIVSNSVDGLLMSGTFSLPCQGCADVPTDFKHTNVVGVLMPAANPSGLPRIRSW